MSGVNLQRPPGQFFEGSRQGTTPTTNCLNGGTPLAAPLCKFSRASRKGHAREEDEFVPVSIFSSVDGCTIARSSRGREEDDPGPVSGRKLPNRAVRAHGSPGNIEDSITFCRRNVSNSDASCRLLAHRAPAESGYVPLRISFLLRDDVVGDMVSRRDPEKISTDVSNSSGMTRSPQGDQVVHVRDIARPNEDDQPRVGRRPPPRASGRHWVGDGQHQHPARPTPTRSRISGLFTSPKKIAPRSRPSRTNRVTQVDDDVGNVRRAQHAGEILSVHPYPEMITWFSPAPLRRPPPLSPPAPSRERGDERSTSPQTGRPHQERRRHHRENGDREEILVHIRTHQAVPNPSDIRRNENSPTCPARSPDYGNPPGVA